MIPRRLESTLLACLLAGTACTTVRTYEYGRSEIPATESKGRIVGVTRTSGVRVTFDRGTENSSAVEAPRIEEDAVVGMADGQPLRVELSETSSVWVEEKRLSIGRTLLLAAGLAFGIPYLSRR